MCRDSIDTVVPSRPSLFGMVGTFVTMTYVAYAVVLTLAYTSVRRGERKRASCIMSKLAKFTEYPSLI